LRVPLRGAVFSVRGVLRPNRVVSCGSLERFARPIDVQPPIAWHGFGGVAVVAHKKPCAQSLVGRAPQHCTPNATPLRRGSGTRTVNKRQPIGGQDRPTDALAVRRVRLESLDRTR
jgi:hypothetical protein